MEFAALELVDKIILNMDKMETRIGFFLDLSKAFDTLHHEISLCKLKYYGFNCNALNLMKSYLTNRKQFVQIDDTQSDFYNIITGVPQGSILGPLLFIIYILMIFVRQVNYLILLYMPMIHHCLPLLKSF